MFGGYSLLPVKDKRAAKARKYLKIGVYDLAADETEDYYAYYEDDDNLYIPRHYGNQIGVRPYVTKGATIPSFRIFDKVDLWDKQKPFVNQILAAIDGGACDLRTEAHTGSGKTTMALAVARMLNTPVLIVVDQEFLRDQWYDRATSTQPGSFGIDPKHVGFIQGKVCQWEGKAVIVAMLQTLYRKDMPEEFWDYVGLAVFDESHTVGAAQYSEVLGHVSCIRLLISATAERKDALEKVLVAHCGEVAIRLEAQHKKSVVRYLEFDNCCSWYATTTKMAGRYLEELSGNGDRNMLCVEAILAMYEEGRNVLVIGDRIEQLEDIKCLLEYSGIPADECGLVSGFSSRWVWAKDDKPKRKPYGYQKGTEYTPVKMQRVRKRTPKKVQKTAIEKKRIVLATFSIFEKGVDVPYLDAGIDVTPQKDSTQAHGRILRSVSGKLTPLWVTVRDMKCYRAEFQFSRRLIDYMASNAEVYKWHLGTGTIRVDPAELRRAVERRVMEMRNSRIVTKLDGNYTITIPLTGTR